MSLMKMRRNGNKIPTAFWIIFVVTIVVSIAFVAWIPIDIPGINTYPLKVLMTCGLILGLSFLFVWLYAKNFRK